MRFMYLHLYLIIQRARPKRLALEFRRMTNESARYVRALRPVRDFLVRSFGETGLSLSLSPPRTIEIRSYEAITSLRHRARIIAITLIALRSRSLRFGQRVFGMNAVA